MSSETISQILGSHLVTSELSVELWHRVALGQISPDEAEARLMQGREVSEDERAAIARAKQVFAAPSDERREACVEALLVQRSGECVPREGPVVVSMRPRRTRRWVVGLLAAAAAVVLTVWLVPQKGTVPFSGRYEIELDKAATTLRGREHRSEVPTFWLDGAIEIRLVPAAPVSMSMPVGVMAYVWDRTGRARRLEFEPTIDDAGVMILDTTTRALGLGEGEHELVMAVGWAESLPSSWEEIVEAEVGGSSGFEVVRKRLRIVASTSEGGGE